VRKIIHCKSCGTTGTIAKIKEVHPKAHCCCPERETEVLVPIADVERLLDAIIKTKQAMEWRYPICGDDQCGFTTEESNAYDMLCSILDREGNNG